MPGESVVHVIDDDAAVRDSLSFLLASVDIEAVTHELAAAFLDDLPAPLAGCIVTDIRMPGVSGLELIRELHARDINVPVIVITGHGDVPMAVEAMKQGASDFIEKPFDDDTLLAAVRSALERGRDAGAREARQAEVREKVATLSERERQVLDGLIAGKPNKTIAFDLGISPRTVEIYRANVMTKMQAGSLSELVRMTLVAGPFGENA